MGSNQFVNSKSDKVIITEIQMTLTQAQEMFQFGMAFKISGNHLFTLLPVLDHSPEHLFSLF